MIYYMRASTPANVLHADRECEKLQDSRAKGEIHEKPEDVAENMVGSGIYSFCFYCVTQDDTQHA